MRQIASRYHRHNITTVRVPQFSHFAFPVKVKYSLLNFCPVRVQVLDSVHVLLILQCLPDKYFLYKGSPSHKLSVFDQNEYLVCIFFYQ